MDAPINILIVDDEPKNLAVLESILDDPGYRLVRAESADQALLALLVEEFALLILDIRMPRMTGIELAGMIKERKKNSLVPIIFLTAYYNEDQHILAGYDKGAVDYLQKPVNAAILRSKVAVFAELHRKSREVSEANLALLAEVDVRRQAEDRLRELNDTLEQRVAERTEALNASLHEKELLLSEVHHRVKNNLQIVCSLLNLQLRRLTDPEMMKIFASTRNRVWAMSAVHERLYESGDFARIEMGSHLQGLLRMLTQSHAPSGVNVQPVFDFEPVTVELKTAVPLSLIASELMTNALKYAFVEGARTGALTVGLRAGDTHHELRIADDGPGFPADIDPATSHTLGLRLVRDLTRQIHGELKIDSTPTGTTVVVRWPACPLAVGEPVASGSLIVESLEKG
jgi:two-component sensor histidine kinase/CheY-like chemotaxis protein